MIYIGISLIASLSRKISISPAPPRNVEGVRTDLGHSDRPSSPERGGTRTIRKQTEDDDLAPALTTAPGHTESKRRSPIRAAAELIIPTLRREPQDGKVLRCWQRSRCLRTGRRPARRPGGRSRVVRQVLRPRGHPSTPKVPYHEEERLSRKFSSLLTAGSASVCRLHLLETEPISCKAILFKKNALAACSARQRPHPRTRVT